MTAASAVAIKGSPHAWLSFALGADALIEGELTSEEVDELLDKYYRGKYG